jgi:hypothetical protein
LEQDEKLGHKINLEDEIKKCWDINTFSSRLLGFKNYNKDSKEDFTEKHTLVEEASRELHDTKSKFSLQTIVVWARKPTG